MMNKHPLAGLILGLFCGAILTLASILAAREVTPVPLRQPELKYGQNLDLPGVSGEPVFHMTMSIDGFTSTFSCVKHNTELQHEPGAIPQ